MKALVAAKSKFEKVRNGSKEKARETIAKIAGRRPVIKGAHLAARIAFQQIGFRFETRVQGDLKLGLIRIRLPNPFVKKKARATGAPIRRAVFVPGFGDTPLSWLPVLVPLKPALSTKVEELIIVDFPGFGGFLSDEPSFDSMDSLQAFFTETMASLQPTILMGHSLGGWLSADYAAKTTAEKQPENLILIDPSGVIVSESEKEAFKIRFEEALDGGFAKLGPHVFARQPFWFKWLAHEFSDFLERTEVRSFVRSIREEHLVEKRLGHIVSKTWILWGEKDTLSPASWMNEWIEGLRHIEARGAIIRGSGHSPHVEKPAVTLALLTQILMGRGPIDAIGRPFWKLTQ